MKEYIRGLKTGIPIGLGYLSVSFTFGLMATQKNMSIIASLLISMTNLTSAGQFAGLDIITAGGTLIELCIATFIINIRYLLMSLSLSQKIDQNMTTWQRMLISFGITDEVYALSMQKESSLKFIFMLGLITTPYIGWSLGTFLGAYASNVLPLLIRQSLSIAIYGMFIAIIIPPSKKSKPVLCVTLLACAISLIFKFIPNISSGWTIIICTIISSGIGALLFSREDSENEV